MELTMTNAISAAATNERELTDVELKDELSGEQLQKVSGGNPSGPGESSASFHDFNFTHRYDKASPVL
jgi:type VI protein secretion system component Hcp